MNNVVARRALLEAVNALVRTNDPTSEHYAAVQNALSVVASHDYGVPLEAIFRNVRKPAADARPT